MNLEPTIPCNPDGMPEELRLWPQWVLWKLLPNSDPSKKPTKLLINACTLRAARTHNLAGKTYDDTPPDTWTDYETARASLERNGKQFCGLGFVFTETDPYCAGDIDDCRLLTGEMTKEAQMWVGMANTYTEVSQSGTGVHFIARAKKTRDGKKKADLHVEMYDNKRFFALTGLHLDGTPTTIEDRQKEFETLESIWFPAKKPTPRQTAEAARYLIGGRDPIGKSDADLLDTAYKASNGEKIKALYAGQTLPEHKSESEARFALLRMLAFYTQGEGGGGVEQLERLFRQSCRDQSKCDRLLPGECEHIAQDTTTVYQGKGRYIPHQFTGTPRRQESPAYGSKFPGLPPEGITEEEAETLRQRSLDAELSGYPLTDLGNCERLVRRFGHDLRYNPRLEKWLLWNGRQWKVDEDGAIFRYAKKTCRAINHEVSEAKEEERNLLRSHAHKTESSDRIGAMVRMARTEEGIPVNPDDLDAQTFLLPVANGLLNLRTGELGPHNREALNTHLIDIEYDPAATCDVWEQWLDWAMGGNQEMILFLQRAVGYILTGDTSQHCLFFLIGGGENGKSTFTTTVENLLGPYWQKATAETFLHDMQSSAGRATPHIAKLAGARLVTVNEMPQGGRLNESLVKDTVSADSISARFLNKDEFTFKPQFKLVWYGNHRPKIRGTDNGIWRRIRLIPFNQKIPTGKRDATLRARIDSELPGILAWAVRGYLDLIQQPGEILVSPVDVVEATEDLRTESDPIALFIASECDTGPELSESASALLRQYNIWREQDGQPELNARSFGDGLRDKGYLSHRKKGGIWRVGLALKPDACTAPDVKTVYSSARVYSCAADSDSNALESLREDVSYGETYTNIHPTPEYTPSANADVSLQPYAEMIADARAKRIPVQYVKLQDGTSCANLNGYIVTQAKAATTAAEAGDDAAEAEALEELRLCAVEWRKLMGGV